MKNPATAIIITIFTSACLARASRPNLNITIKHVAEIMEVHENKLVDFLKQNNILEKITLQVSRCDSLPPICALALTTGKTVIISGKEWQKMALHPAPEGNLEEVARAFSKKKNKSSLCTIL